MNRELNIIVATHRENGKPLIFSVPEHLTGKLYSGGLLLVDTARGKAVATALTGVLSGETAVEAIAKTPNVYFPLKPVLDYLQPEFNDYIQKSVIDTSANLIAEVLQVYKASLQRRGYEV